MSDYNSGLRYDHWKQRSNDYIAQWDQALKKQRRFHSPEGTKTLCPVSREDGRGACHRPATREIVIYLLGMTIPLLICESHYLLYQPNAAIIEAVTKAVVA